MAFYWKFVVWCQQGAVEQPVLVCLAHAGAQLLE
jgi:hypothetical protein